MKLSIITINRNNAEGLSKTMESVLAQTYRDFEYIIIDGASTDGSVDVIREYESSNHSSAHPLFITWISEPDTGIYNAMNKGLRKANGEYTLMLNSGDFLVDEHVLERIMPELHTEDMIQGNLIEEFPDKTIRKKGYGRSNITFIDAFGGYFLHQALFIRLSTMEQYGYYDESYRKGADTYFFLTSLAFGNATFRYVDVDVANFDVNGISFSNDAKWKQIEKEENARWYGEHVSSRLMELYHSAPSKISLYDTLHDHKWAWRIVRVLLQIISIKHPQRPQLVEEVISK